MICALFSQLLTVHTNLSDKSTLSNTIKHLLLHIAILHRARLLNEAVSKGGFTVVNMRHDREITDFVQLCHKLDMSWFHALVKVANASRFTLRFGKALPTHRLN